LIRSDNSPLRWLDSFHSALIADVCASSSGVIFNTFEEELRDLLKENKFEQAYSVGKKALELEPNNLAIIESLKMVTAALSSQCMDMASRKQDCAAAYFECEDLLRKVNELTKQEIYGRQV
tara:strand:- start:517 stop:879 length:363 start_codon:yes stop_codon:yes gene_type:complete